jgi:hypothetical protein
MARIDYAVPLVEQASQNTCWLACFRMLIRFEQSQGRRLNAIAEAVDGADFVARMETLDRTLFADAPGARRFARECGMWTRDVPGLTEAHPEFIENPYTVHDILKRYGPFAYAGLLPGGVGHMIVIRGFDDGPGFEISFNDPRPGVGHRRIGYSTFRRGFPPAGMPIYLF